MSLFFFDWFLVDEDLAEVLGCNRGSLANYETGKRTPDIDTIIKIAKKLVVFYHAPDSGHR